MKRREFLAGSLGTLGASAPLVGIAASLPCPPSPVTVTGGIAVATPCPAPTGTMPAWFKSASVFQWVTLPSLSTSGVLPNPVPPGITGVKSVTDAWGAGALRQNGSYYILHGGGHGDYAGNEIYALQLSLDNPQWQRIWGPTPNADIVENQYYYNDSPQSPASIHSYYCLAYDDQDDIFMRFTRGRFGVPNFVGGIDGIRWGASSWEQNQNNTIWPAPVGCTYANGQCKDTSGNVYLINSWKRFLWNRAANSWSVPIANSSYSLQSSGSCYDSARHAVWSFGGSYGGGSVGAGQAYMWDISTNNDSLISLVGANATSIDGINANFSGVAYDPVADLVFVLTGDGYIYSFVPSTHEVTRLTTAGASLPNTQSTSATGPWGKFQYVSQLGGVVIQPTWASPTFFMRTH